MLDFDKLTRFQRSRFQIVTLIPEWASAYEVDPPIIERAIMSAHAWCNANPRKAPRRDVVRFLYNYMRKAKEYGNLTQRKPTQPVPQPDEPDMSYEEAVQIRRRNMGSTTLKRVDINNAVDTSLA